MPEENKRPKMKLSRAPEQLAAEEQARKANAEPEKPNAPLTLQHTEVSRTYVSTNADKIRIDDILEDAYSPEKKRARQASILRRIALTCAIALLFLVSAGLTYGYAHIYQQWPKLEPLSWYLPFVLSVALSVAALIKSYQFITRRRSSIALTITGLVIAAGLASWNLDILRVTSWSGDNLLGQGHWQPSNQTEMLIAYEINACRGIPPASFTAPSAASYKKMFRSMPRSQWQPYFKKYLTHEELQKTTPLNIDINMREVSSRMARLHAEQWADFEAVYKNPPFDFKVKQWALLPYSTILQQL
ncbi:MULTISPECIES: MerC domain-containing protein [unclassified Lentimonas]|uniref:MerC domain-containing protein n=1 Tax=unclassified Lentimonas TaxID=2630993 RepID=UPI0013246EAA|nr:MULTISPECIES: MerC domain-containing protein [unclassified Lentimonas]CAA6689876.1 Unannotated [Lentimonas sp. CC10]CAA6697153.1 Unannotated [Lentimonas sp. CC19]CAA7069427.1 Unannotated [Lentimonas sp. CC11]